MHLLTDCPVCRSDALASRPIALELHGHNVGEAQCDQGHVVSVQLENYQFELLFELAALALLDGYFREAVSGFAAALERFLEFYLRVVALAANVKPNEVATAWKAMSNQSERQLGAFAMAYLLVNRRVAPLLGPKHIELRNKATHKGVLPTRDEAIGYGEAVLKLILQVGSELEVAGLKPHFDTANELAAEALFGDRPGTPPTVGLRINTIVNMSLPFRGFGAPLDDDQPNLLPLSGTLADGLASLDALRHARYRA